METKDVIDGLVGVLLDACDTERLHDAEDETVVELLDSLDSAMDLQSAGVPSDWDGFVLRMKDGSVYHFTARKVSP